MRSELLEKLYYGLPEDDRQRVLTGKKVTSIASDDVGVSVTCSDGATYTGSMIIGADGAHSATRLAMRRLALDEDPNRAWDPENPFVSEYKLAWFRAPTILDRGCFNFTYASGYSAMWLSLAESSCGIIYAKLPEPTRERTRYTKRDLEEYVAQYAHLPATETHTFGDVVDLSMAGMVNVEEGLAENWSWGRIVLIGDACHKMSPNLGMGYQAGLQDIVDLANRLRRALRAAPDRQPDVETLGKTFEDYKTSRAKPLSEVLDVSHKGIRLHTRASWIDWIFTRFIFSWDFAMRYLVGKSAPRIARSLVLDYVPASEPMMGRVKWEHPMPESSDTGDSGR